MWNWTHVFFAWILIAISSDLARFFDNKQPDNSVSKEIDNIEPGDEQGKYVENKNFKMEIVNENEFWQFRKCYSRR